MTTANDTAPSFAKSLSEALQQGIPEAIQEAAGKPFHDKKPSELIVTGMRLMIGARMARAAARQSTGGAKAFYYLTSFLSGAAILGLPVVDKVLEERRRRLNDINPADLEFLRTGKR